ncbi:pilus assembly protein TadE [Ornithinimicrobium sp. Arc0846-15]|nr:pilus assembly protein TadE [Ornithinimicrobium laminariae]
MATAELAMAIPALVVVLAMCLSGLSLVIDQVRCADAARVAARAASRGEPMEVVQTLGAQGAPSGATVAVSIGQDQVIVTVQAAERWSWLPAASSVATAPTEPGL